MEVDDIIEKYNLTQSTWTNKGFHGVLHTFFPVGEMPILPFRKYYGDSHTITVVFFHEDYGNWYWNDNDMTRLRNSLIENVNENTKFLDNWCKLWDKLLRKFIKTYKKCDIDLIKLTDRKLLDLYKQFYEDYVEEYGVAIGFQDAFSMHADRFFVPIVKDFLNANKCKRTLEDVFPIITVPVTGSFVAKEYKERLKILIEINKNKNAAALFKNDKELILNEINKLPKINKLLESHARKWFWIENNYAVQKTLDKGYFIEKLVNEINIKTNPEKSINDINNKCLKAKKEKAIIIKELKLNNEIKNLIKITEVFAYMQDERKKYVLIANHYIKKFYEEIGRRVGLTSKEMAYAIYPEMEDILIKKKFDRQKHDERRKHCVCICTLNGHEIIEGNVVDELFSKVFKHKDNVQVISGTCASKGKAKGIVKIVRKVHDLANVYKGDILVASMTRPEMVAAMEKAAAIVTDEGGITSHAAIVSRELGIPCIVGTKNATSVLKNGDLVEVDAMNGTVRKIMKQ